MKKALIIVHNKDNTTRRYGEEIAQFLLYRGLQAELIPAANFDPGKLSEADYLLLSGLESDNEWESFVKKLPSLNGIRTALFTTYKFFSGGIFRKMKKYLSKKIENLDFELKSRDGSLSVSDKLALNDFIKE